MASVLKYGSLLPANTVCPHPKRILTCVILTTCGEGEGAPAGSCGKVDYPARSRESTPSSSRDGMPSAGSKARSLIPVFVMPSSSGAAKDSLSLLPITICFIEDKLASHGVAPIMVTQFWVHTIFVHIYYPWNRTPVRQLSIQATLCCCFTTSVLVPSYSFRMNLPAIY